MRGRGDVERKRKKGGQGGGVGAGVGSQRYVQAIVVTPL